MFIANQSRRFYFVQSSAALVRLAPRAISLVKRADEAAVNSALAGALSPAVADGDLTVVPPPAAVADQPTFEDDGPDGWLEYLGGLP